MDKSLMPKSKHDHKWTNKLKVIIFALLMLAPFFAILSKMIYVSANKNAKDSYYGETINEKQYIYITNHTQLTQGQIYYGNTTTDITNIDTSYGGSLIAINVADVNYNETQYDSVSRITFYHQANASKDALFLRDINNNVIEQINTDSILINTLEFRYIGNLTAYGDLTTLDIFLNDLLLKKIEYNNYSYLDNVFYYAVDQMKNDQLFKWVDNTIVYNGLNAMNTGFGLPTNHVLTYLLAYWTILTAIYIVIDIILFLFTKLTHLLQ